MHLTNASVQKKHSEYNSEAGQDSLWSLPRLEEYLIANTGVLGEGVAPVTAGWAGAGGALQASMKGIILDVFKAAKGNSLAAKDGYFDLVRGKGGGSPPPPDPNPPPLTPRHPSPQFGVDFLLDDTLKLHLLEVNTNPALHLDNKVLASLLPPMVAGALRLVLDAHGHDAAKGEGEGEVAAGAAGEGEGEGEGEAASGTAVAGGPGFELLVDERSGFEWSV